jgi:hypothetical protein
MCFNNDEDALDRSEKIAAPIQTIQKIFETKPGDNILPPDFGMPDVEFAKELDSSNAARQTGNNDDDESC